MKHFKLLLCLLCCITSLWGCALFNTSKTVVVLLPDNDGKVGKIQVQNNKGTIIVKQPNESVTLNKDRKPESSGVMHKKEFQERFDTAIKAEPIQPSRYFINFHLGKSTLVPQSKSILKLILADINKRPLPQVIVQGHADRRGEEQRNYVLSRQRAQKVEKLLLKAGIPEDIIETSAHGEKYPFIPTEDDVPNLLNRRVEVIVR